MVVKYMYNIIIVVIIRALRGQLGAGLFGSPSAPLECWALALLSFQAASRCTHQQWWTGVQGGIAVWQGSLPTRWDRWHASMQLSTTWNFYKTPRQSKQKSVTCVSYIDTFFLEGTYVYTKYP